MKGEELKALLKKYRIKQYEAAEQFGVTTNTVSRWCREGTPNDAVAEGIPVLLEKQYGRVK